ncbi:MAG: hypothetical protein NTW16_01815 [Bacteroidetes bacterium]|nr:hypothetical protein [Bacteroidota bacterium]
MATICCSAKLTTLLGLNKKKNEPEITAIDPHIGKQLNQTPMGAVKYAFPVKLMKELLNKI